MRRLALSLIVVLGVSCAGHKVPAPAVTLRYVFLEQLPPETELCVRSNPWVEGVTCVTLGEFRDLVRGIKQARAPVSPRVGRAP